MKLNRYIVVTSVFLLFSLPLVNPNAVASDSPEKYSTVTIHSRTPGDINALLAAGVALDHIGIRSPNSFDVLLNEREIEVLKSSGVPYEILVNDVIAEYRRNVNLSPEALKSLESSMKSQYNTDGFGFGSMGGYYTFDEVVAELDSARLLYPSLISAKQSIGTSLQGRNIWMVKISDNPDIDEPEQEVLYTGLHHAREPQGMACVMYFINYLLENYGTDSDVTFLVDNRELYFVPVVNPDGYVYNQQTNPNGGGLWRKNRRNNGDGTFGVDLNRNYGYQWGYDNLGSSPFTSSETYRGTAPFSEPETQVIRDFVISHSFSTSLNYHSYSNLLIYPWGFIPNFVTIDSSLFIGMADDMTQFNNYAFGTANQTVGYVVNGEANDWMYGEQTAKPKILAMTPEVGSSSDGFWPNPSRIFPLAEENVYPNIQVAKGPSALFTVSLSLSSLSGNGTFSYTIMVTNNSVIRQNVAILLSISGPGGYSATIFNRNRNIAPGVSFSRTQSYTIRNRTLGDYVITLSPTEGGFLLGSDVETYSKTSLVASKTEASAPDDLPIGLTLEQNFPNPFNPSTTIRYGVAEDGYISLKVYNILGQEVATLVDGFQEAGFKAVVWDGTNNEGEPVADGLYLYKINNGSSVKVQKMVLLK